MVYHLNVDQYALHEESAVEEPPEDGTSLGYWTEEDTRLMCVHGHFLTCINGNYSDLDSLRRIIYHNAN